MNLLFFISLTFKENLITNAVEINGDGTEILGPANVSKITIVSKMKEITINGIKEISNNAFQGCASVTSVFLPICMTKIGDYAFDGLKKLSFISFSNTNLQHIGRYAFSNTLISCPVEFPSQLNFIGSYAFGYVGTIPSMTFKNTVKLTIEGSLSPGNPKISIIDLATVPVVLKADVFMQMSNLSTIIIGELVEIDENPFHSCYKLVNIIVQGSKYYSDNNQILYSADKSTLICIPGGVEGTVTLLPETTIIGYSAGRHETAKNIVCPSVKVINTLGFFWGWVETISLPKLEKLVSRAFESSLLVSITLPNTFIDIDNSVFGNCDNLTYLFLPKSIEIVRGGFLSGCSKLVDVVIEEGSTLLERDQTTRIVTSKINEFHGFQPFFIFIPPTVTEVIIPGSMPQIPFATFRGMKFLKSIKISSPNTYYLGAESLLQTGITELFIPKSIKHVGNAFCLQCTSLVKVVYEKDSPLTQIPSQAFSGCTALTTIEFPDNCVIENFVSLSFSGCKALKEFVFPQTTKRIDLNAFNGCSGLEKLTIRGTDVEIAFNSFLNCNSLSLITFDTNLVSSFSFQDLKLKKLIFSSKIVEIGTSAFSRNLLLHTLEFDNLTNNLVTVGTNAFSSCILLKEVYFPGSVKELTANIFHGCNSLISVKVNSNEYKTINGILYSKTEDILILCPSGLGECHVSNLTTKLGKYSFAGCLNLKNVYLSSNISRIEDFCFFECSKLKSFNIPTGIKYIGESPLFKCESLKLISYCGTTDKDIFTPNRNDLLPEKSILLVSNKYLGDTFLGKKVLKSDSLDPYDCPNLPSLFFSINKHAKKFHNFNTNFGMMILKYLFFIHH